MRRDVERSSAGFSADWLVGGGEMGELIRRTDWSATVLGPRQRWPVGLRTVVRLLVESQFPMALLWGRELILLYNDPYRVIAADRHPRALGRSTREVWPEVWHINEPIFRAVLERGETIYLEDKLFPIDRHGQREQAYFTLCYSPVRAEDGAVAGTLVTLLETTRRVREEQALRAERNQVAAAAARERELLTGVLEHVPAMITIYDPRLETFHLNAETRRVLGWTDEDASTGDLMALCYPDPSYREEVRRFMESAEPGWREFEVTAKDGSKVTSSWANVRLSDSTQIGIGLDLRDRKRAESELRDSEQQLRALYERNPAMVVLSELDDGRIVRANEGFTRMLGFSVEEVLGRTPVELGIFPRAEDRQRIIEEVNTNGFVRNLEVTVRGKSGAPVMGLLSSTVIESHDNKRLVTVMTDITDRKRAEEALRESEERFRALATASSQVFYRMSPDWSEMRQLRSQGFLANTETPNPNWLQEYIHPDDQAQVRAAIDAAIRTKSAFELEHRVWRADGTLGWTSSRAVPITDANGDLVEWFGAAIDITDRRRAEEALRQSERLQRLLAETGALAAGASKVDDLVKAVGERVARELGVSRCGFSEVDLDAGIVVVLKDYHGDLTSIAGTFPIDKLMEHRLTEGLAGLPSVIEDVATHPRTAGLYREAFAPIRVRAHLTVPLHRGGKWVACFWAGHHQTRHWSPGDVEMMKRVAERVWPHVERKRAEEALRVANDRLVEADRRKDEFLAVLSHELRNPLAPIRNSVYILEHAVPGGEQASRARQVIDRQAQHMTRLIEDLLDVTRISKGKISLQRERVDLNAVARGTAEDHRGLFARNGVELETDVGGEPLWVDGDRTRLAQVVGNLLSNSAKFTPRGGRTILSVEATSDGNAILRVRDSGAGMSEETLQHLFEPFVQAPQTLERTRGGLGLGLALVKGLVEMHGGEVTAASEGLGKGSELTVTLPRQAPARPRLSVVPATNRTTTARRVLVVEDNADAAESLREALELGDHEVAIAYSGPEGIELARKLEPDVVLCDIGLPGVDGYGVARALRADPDPSIRTTFLIALSGYALPEDVAKSTEAGFDRHMAKPPSIEALEKLLAEGPAQAAAK